MSMQDLDSTFYGVSASGSRNIQLLPCVENAPRYTEYKSSGSSKQPGIQLQ